MQISDLKINKEKRIRKTEVGRGVGSGMGKTSGRGHKGQRARSGGRKPPWFEGGQQRLVRRLPKIGFRSKFSKEYEVVNLDKLNEKFNNGDFVNAEVLFKKNLIKDVNSNIKILADGELLKALKIKAHKFSKNAIEKIKKAGGEVEIIK
jgi:large subunit ribosomal protein L15